MVDGETRQLAALALRNEFWRDFSGLVNQYLSASAGLLDDGDQEQMMGEMTSVYGCDPQIELDPPLDIVSIQSRKSFHHKTLLEALECSAATEIFVCSRKVFERRAGEWHSVADESLSDLSNSPKG